MRASHVIVGRGVEPRDVDAGWLLQLLDGGIAENTIASLENGVAALFAFQILNN